MYFRKPFDNFKNNKENCNFFQNETYNDQNDIFKENELQENFTSGSSINNDFNFPKENKILERLNELEKQMKHSNQLLDKIFVLLGGNKFEAKKFPCYFVDKIFSSREDECNFDGNILNFKLKILTNYDDLPLLYPFGETNSSDLPVLKKNIHYKLNFKNNLGVEGEIDSEFTKIKNNYVFQLDKNYAQIIQEFPCELFFNSELKK